MFNLTPDQIIKFSSFDGAYQGAVKKLLKAITEAPTTEEKKQIFDAFEKDHTVIPELWAFRAIQMEDWHGYQEHFDYFRRAASHFYSPFLFKGMFIFFDVIASNTGLIPFQRCYENPYADDLMYESLFKSTKHLKFIENSLTFPHDRLDVLYECYGKHSSHPMPPEILKEYHKAQAFKLSVSNFQEQDLFKFGDQYAIQTIESYLARHYDDKDVWKCYINLMKHRNFKVMLQIFHRYTRLFLNDVEMQQKYMVEKENAKLVDGFDEFKSLKSYLFTPLAPSMPDEWNLVFDNPHFQNIA